jgi:1,4-alpha-glucan branching enzyme
LLRDLNAAYRDAAALWSTDTTPEGFGWLAADDAAHNTYAFVRYATDGAPLVCVVNFAAVPQHAYRIGLPRPGRWDEIINTDAAEYGGSGVGNLGAVAAEDVAWQGFSQSAEIQVPPLGAVWLRPAA